MWKDSTSVVSLKKDTFGILDAVVLFSNAPEKDRTVTFHAVQSQSDLKRLVLNQADAWDSFDAASAAIPLGPLDSKPVVIVPTQDEIDRAAFRVLYLKLGRLKRGRDLGIVDDKAFTDAQSEALAAFKPEYENLL